MAMTKKDFQDLVNRISTACAQIDAVYPQMIAAAKFDRELIVKLEAAMRADKDLLEYVKSKTESQLELPSTVIIGLLGR